MTESQLAILNGWSGLRPPNEHAAQETVATELIGILDAVDVPIFVIRRDFTVACFNQAAANVLGFAPSHIGLTPREVPSLARMPDLKQRCEDIIAGDPACRVDFRHGDKSFVVRIAPYSKSDSQVTGAVLTFTNVTAFRASIDQAIYEREYTKAILNTVTDPLLVLGADQRVQSANRAFYAMFLTTRDQTQGLALYDLAQGAFDVAEVRAQLNAMLADGHAIPPIEINQSWEAGQRALVLNARLLSLPGQPGHRILLSFQDITERKKAEQAQYMLVGELQHRVKNTLATVQAIASQTLHSASEYERESFIGRLHALGNAHDVLTKESWDRAPLRDVVNRALQPFQKERIAIAGPYVPLEANKALVLTRGSCHENHNLIPKLQEFSGLVAAQI